MIDKKRIIDHILAQLGDELKIIEASAESARQAATSDEARPENEYDTRAVEAGYLASAQNKRAEELRNQLLMYKHLPLRELGKDDVACAGALVELETNKRRAYYFVAPSGGGLSTSVEGHPVQVVTPASVIGDALMGRKVGETFDIELRDSVRIYKILSIR